jgi:hypothetical protein
VEFSAKTAYATAQIPAKKKPQDALRKAACGKNVVVLNL